MAEQKPAEQTKPTAPAATATPAVPATAPDRPAPLTPGQQYLAAITSGASTPSF